MNKKRKKIRLNSYSKLDALVQIAEFMYQNESKMTDLSIDNMRGNGVNEERFEKLCSPRDDDMRFSIRTFNSSNDLTNNNGKNRSIFV